MPETVCQGESLPEKLTAPDGLAVQTLPDDLPGAVDFASFADRAAEATDFLKKLANQDRLMIVCTLIQGERSVRHIERVLGLRQPSLSQQLRELRHAGMIENRKEGKHMYYRLADARVAALVGTLYQIFCK